MRLLRGIGKWFWRFMVIFSFIVNFVLIVILLLAGLFIFQIKDQVADPLIGGLHSTAVGLKEATIDWTIPVRVDDLPVNLSVPINANTITSQVTEINGVAVNPIPGETLVRLTRPVPVTIHNAFINSNDLTLRNATVNITLPANLALPVALEMDVEVNSTIPVELDVRAVIPLSETQLKDPVETLTLLFEPLAIGLYNLPNNFGEVGGFVGAVLDRNGVPWNEHISTLLLSPDGNGFREESYDAWVGFSRTVGLDYDMDGVDFLDENEAMETNLVAPGGIPSLDSQIERRAEYYTDGERPKDHNAEALANLEAANIPAQNYDGSYSAYYVNLQGGVSRPFGQSAPSTQGNTPAIIPTPSSP